MEQRRLKKDDEMKKAIVKGTFVRAGQTEKMSFLVQFCGKKLILRLQVSKK